MAQPRSQELTEALSALINQQPFFAVILFNLLEIVETNTLPSGASCNTAATNGKQLFVSPSFFKRLTVQERVYVLAHEVSHKIFQHPERMKGYMDLGFGPDMKVWQGIRFNKAADYMINDNLNDLKVGSQPLGSLLNGQYGRDDLVDDIYCKLPEEEDDPQGNGGGWDQHMPSDQPETGSDKAEIQRAVAMAAAAAKAQGTLPAGLQRIIDAVIDPEIPWEDYLERKLVCLQGTEEASWHRTNRRKLVVAPHVPWPGRVGNRCGTGVVEIDTSGSIGQDEINVFGGTLAGVLRSVSPEMIHLMFVDAALFQDRVIDIENLDDLPGAMGMAGGGGGTDMTVVFREIEKRQLQADFVIILTDGYTPFGDAQEVPTYWCITSPDITAPWGTTIHVKLEK